MVVRGVGRRVRCVDVVGEVTITVAGVECCEICGAPRGAHALFCPYVDCDRDCRALKEPSSYAEVVKALEHWRLHPLCGGCSHGC